MEVRTHDDPAEWLEAVLPLLMLDEARHNLHLGLAHTLVHHPSVYPSKHLWSVEDAGTVVGAALQTPPHNLILGQPSAEGANDLLADAIESAGIQLPGVVGGLPEAEAFALAWCARTGNTARRVMGQGIYSLTEVLPVPAVAGTPRTARPDDLNLVAGWIQAFQDEVVPGAIRRNVVAASAPSSGPTRKASVCGKRRTRSSRCPGSGVRPRTGSGSGPCTHRQHFAAAATRRRWSPT